MAQWNARPPAPNNHAQVWSNSASFHSISRCPIAARLNSYGLQTNECDTKCINGGHLQGCLSWSAILSQTIGITKSNPQATRSESSVVRKSSRMTLGLALVSSIITKNELSLLQNRLSRRAWSDPSSGQISRLKATRALYKNKHIYPLNWVKYEFITSVFRSACSLVGAHGILLSVDETSSLVHRVTGTTFESEPLNEPLFSFTDAI